MSYRRACCLFLVLLAHMFMSPHEWGLAEGIEGGTVRKNSSVRERESSDSFTYSGVCGIYLRVRCRGTAVLLSADPVQVAR